MDTTILCIITIHNETHLGLTKLIYLWRQLKTASKNREFSESVGACDEDITSLSRKFTIINTISFADYPTIYRLVQLNDIGHKRYPQE